MMVNRRGRFTTKLLAAALTVLLLTTFVGISASAAVNSDGLTVEKLSFRDVLRLYTLDTSSFGSDALETDANGVTNAARHLAELFTYTVGLNYDGQGPNANFFGKDVTALMGTAPYDEGSLLATYEVEIAPYHSYATALPQGQTTAIRVYLAGYTNAANGVEPVLHYLWQDHTTWYAVKDDNPYYRVSYNGESARQLSGTGLSITYTRSTDRGTETLQSWQDLTEASDGDGVVHLDCCTLVVGQGTANVFGLTKDLSRLQREGNYSSSLLAVSDFVRGDSSYQTGPLVYSRTVYEADTMRRVTDGESLKEGVRYRFRVVYDEPLAVAKDASWSSVSMNVRSENTGETKNVSDFTWYGGEAYLTTNNYNPHAVEFTFTPSTQGYSVCTFIPVNLVGSESALKAADFHARTETGTAPAAPAATPAPAHAPAQSLSGESGQSSGQTLGSTVVTATPPPAVLSAGAASPTAPTASLDVLFSANEYSSLTRGVMAETLWILAGQPATDVTINFMNQFSDPNLGKAIVWASRTGIIPVEGGLFGANDPVSREEAVVILWRYAAVRGKDVSINSDLSALADASAVSAEYTPAMIWALERGLISSYGDGYLRPAQNATCGETIAMIRTFQQKL